ncbi:hypothetical protein [Candidatus Nitrosocosmicus sp. SS]|uniref:hypothetical protein n=1 Tax=Candidatus Nitrosocosmicus agrestis TaxID=2563600 RepID=UPI00122E3088|nr:hypothetical protein [Candidatus Nitrosocosmicus sp. SS]KAA2280246.1 hypothetical protein F1Z66_11635 [Candidatus Nitrosocosmicus sp. SS]KAF0869497.1 hypothetical protein E5N71_04510 [Candidatus Nitrosocosmicus sp. SS]
MLYSRAVFQTSEPIESAFSHIKETCDKLNGPVKIADEQMHRILGKSRMLSRSAFSINYYIFFSKSDVNTTTVEIYDTLQIAFRPDKRFLEPLVLAIGERIPFVTGYIIDKVESEIAADGWIVRRPTELTIWSKLNDELLKKKDYDIKLI